MQNWAMLSILAFGLLAHRPVQQSSTADNVAFPVQEQSQEAQSTEPQPAQTVAAPASPDSENVPQDSSDPPQHEDSPAPSTETPAAVPVQPASTSNEGSWLGLSAFMIFCIAVLFVFYWLPAMIGFRRKHRNAVPILLVNFFFGWTFIGWVVALIWSVSDNVPAPA